ncbi:hypothetical protein V5O48_018276, partial [Marasmius crinis-equi]
MLGFRKLPTSTKPTVVRLLPTTLCEQCGYTFDPDYTLSPVPSELCRSDRVPTCTEINEILKFIDEEKVLVQQYDRWIAKFRLITKKFTSQKALVKDAIARRRSATSALRRFPVELLGYIFDLACASPPNTKSGDPGRSLSVNNRTIDSPTLNLSQVCSRWRALVIGSPRLWASIAVNMGMQFDHDPGSVVKLYLERSKGCTLDLRLYGRLSSSGISPEGLETHLGPSRLAILRALLNEAHRCRYFSISNVSTFLALVPETREPHFPFLERFVREETGNPFHYLPADHWFVRGIRESAPALYHCATPFTSSVIPCFPWERLSSLDLVVFMDPDLPDNLHQHLSTLSRLQSLTLHFAEWQEERQVGIAVVLPNLQFLSASSVDSHHLVDLFDALSAPSLKRLEVLNAGPHTGIPLDPALVGMLRRSSCTILDLSLTMNAFEMQGSLLLSIAEACPELSALGIDIRRLDEPSNLSKVFSDLTVAAPQSIDPPPSTLFPKLRKISLVTVVPDLSASRTMIDKFLRVAESR